MTTNPTALSTASTPTGALVDRYGKLKAEAADVETRLEDIKVTLIERHGEGKHEGELFRLSMSHTLRSRTDWTAVAAALARKAGLTDKALDALIAEHTSLNDTWVARCNARVTK